MRRRVSLLLICLFVGACGGRPAGAAEGSVRIALEAPSDLDPARTGDAQSSAIISQLFETLTTFDESLELRPALAESWRVEDDGRRVVFRLRPDLRFSDGSPLHATDVAAELVPRHRPGVTLAPCLVAGRRGRRDRVRRR